MASSPQVVRRESVNQKTGDGSRADVRSVGAIIAPRATAVHPLMEIGVFLVFSRWRKFAPTSDALPVVARILSYLASNTFFSRSSASAD